MKRILQISILVFLAIIYLMIALSYADTHTADSCSYAHVNTAVTAASRGDTVSVPAGACTWTSQLLITKAIKLQGAGATEDAAGTRITLAYPTYSNPASDSGSDCGLNMGAASTDSPPQIKYWLSGSAASDANEIFEITGFVFYQSTSVPKMVVTQIINGDVDNPLTKVKIHGNLYRFDLTSTNSWSSALTAYGYVFGAFYNNTLYQIKPHLQFNLNSMDDGTDNGTCAYPLGQHAWINKTHKHSDASASMVIEDNTWYFTDSNATHWGGINFGMLNYIVRYNTFISSDTTATYQGGPDAHGPYDGHYSPMGAEVYGNYFQGSSTCTVGSKCNNEYYTVVLMHPRAGRNVIFNNLAQNSGGDGTLGAAVWIKRACNECSATFSSGTSHACVATTFTECIGKNRCSSDDQPLYLDRTYIFQNRLGAAGTTIINNVSVSNESYAPCGALASQYLPREGYEWFKDNTNCTASSCTAGIGCGASVPTGTCTTGTGYWVTSGSCSALTTDNVGASASTPLSGTLYRCGPTNVWSAYYTPLSYPHPLREGSDTEPPSMTKPCAGSGSCTNPIIQIACDDLDDTEDILLGITATDAAQATTVCYYDLETRADYDAMAADGHELTASGTSFTATAAGLACASQHTFWYACTDGTNDTAVSNTSFVIAGRGDDTQAVITNASTTQQACSTQQKISISTDKPSTCKWSLTDEAYADMDYTFSVTGGETGHVAHSTDVSQNCSESVTRYIRCSTTQGVANSSSTAVTITTDAGKTVAIGSGGLTLGIGSGTNQITILP